MNYDSQLIFEAYCNIYTESRAPSKSCVMAYISNSDKDSIVEYVNGIPQSDLYIDTDDTEGDSYGKEVDSHVTILYGLEPDITVPPIKELLYKEQKDLIGITLGKISIFDNEKYDVLKIDVHSKDLSKLNKAFSKEFPYENDYPDYYPHLTLAYLRKDMVRST